MGTCSPWPPLEEFKGSWRDQNSSSFGKNTHSTHGKWKGINLSTTTQNQLSVSPLALNKEGGEVVLGVLLAPLVWHAWGLATTNTGFHLSYLAFAHWQGSPGSGQTKGCTQTSGAGEWAWVSQDGRTVSPQWLGVPKLSVPKLGAFPSFRQHLFGMCTWIRCPQTFFPESHNQFENTALPKLAFDTGALSPGRAWLHALRSLQSPLCCYTSCTGKKSPSSAATISVAAAAHTGLMCKKEENLGVWVCVTPVWTVQLGLRCLSHDEAHVIMGGRGCLPDTCHIFDTRYLPNHQNPKGFWLKAFKTSSLLPKHSQKV